MRGNDEGGSHSSSSSSSTPAHTAGSPTVRWCYNNSKEPLSLSLADLSLLASNFQGENCFWGGYWYGLLYSQHHTNLLHLQHLAATAEIASAVYAARNMLWRGGECQVGWGGEGARPRHQNPSLKGVMYSQSYVAKIKILIQREIHYPG